MSAKYFVYAGGRWCELDTRTGRVSGFRTRARFCFVRGQRLHAARSAAVLRALRAQAAGAPSAVRDAAPLPRCPRRRLRRSERSRSRRCSGCRPSHAHCCTHSHGRCDVNANSLQSILPTPTAATSDKQRRASSSEQEIRIVESVHKTPVKQVQVSPHKSPHKQNRHNRQSSSDEIKKPAQKSMTRARQSSQQHVNVVVVDKNSKWSSSSDESEAIVSRGKASLMKSPQKQSKHKNSSDDEGKRKPVTRARQSCQVNGAVRIRSSSTSSSSSVEAQESTRGKPSPIKSPQKQSRHKYSSDKDDKRKPVTRARVSAQVDGGVRNRSTSTSSTTSVEESHKSALGKPSPIKSPQKQSRKKNSSDEEEKRKPLTRAHLSSQGNRLERNKSISSTTSTSDEEGQKSKNTGKTTKQMRSSRALEISSDEDSEGQPAKPVTRSRPQTRRSRQDDVVIVEDDSDHNQPVKKTKTVAVKESDTSSEETKTKSQTRRKLSKAEKLTKRLLETTESETGEESEQAGTGTERSARCKELVICESDVETLRRFVKQRGGRENLARFDRDERYKLRIFHRLNPLVSLQRHQPLENLLRQRLTIKEFARNLGLRSVAEVTPEKRYRMRSSTKHARVPSDTEDKENVVKPKRRRLWNNEKSMLDNVRDSISSETPKAKPQIIKPVVDKDSSGDSSDSDAEFKRKVREQLAKKKRRNSLEGGVKVARATEASRLLKENVKPNNSSSAKMAEMLKSSDDEPRRTRSNKIATPKGKPQKFTAVSENDKLKSAKVTDEKDDNEVRKTRSSIKAAESPTKPKPSGNDNVGTTKVTLARNRESFQWEVRNTMSSNVGIPARTLKEQNKKDSSDTDSAFETSKSSPKKANLIRKGKTPSRITNLPNRKGKDGGSKGRDLDSAKAKENNKTSAFVESMTVKPVKFKKSSVANGREYTSLEDHAIVAWVCGGHQRERLVNGNRLWRELALEYQRLTGQDRSWHSLRNRYLRYVLPALGRLALPPAQVSRLRAAAAAGEIKSRGAKQRRNSIFTAPLVSSASSALRDRTGKKDEAQSEKEKKSKTDDKEQRENETREQIKTQTGGVRGKGGRLIKDAPTPKKEPPSLATPRVTRSSVGSPSKGNRK